MKNAIRYFTMSSFIFVCLSLAAISCHGRTISEHDAVVKIQNVEEVRSYIAKIGKAGGDVRPIIREEPGAGDDGGRYEFFVGEGHSSHSVIWHRFQIDKKSGAVFVFDSFAGEFVPLDTWRTKQTQQSADSAP